MSCSLTAKQKKIEMKKPLSKLERDPLREAWKHEANDFTPWLAEEDNLNTRADALGLPDQKLVATEQSQKPQPPNWQDIDIGRAGSSPMFNSNTSHAHHVKNSENF